MADLIDREATLAAIEQRAKDELADVNHYYLMGFQDAAETVENMPKAELATDCISRLAAIDVIENFGILDGYSDRMELIDRIKHLPPTQPESNVHDLPKDTDCISRQAAVEALEKWEAESIWDDYLYLHRDEPGCEPPSSVVKALPAAQPEMVLCKNCKHHHYECGKIPYCDRIDYGYGWKDDDFCSRAERKDGEAE